MIKSPSSFTPPTREQIHEVLIAEARAIVNHHESGEILYNEKTGEVEANKQCPHCEFAMDFNDHFAEDSIAQTLSGKSWAMSEKPWSLDGPIELMQIAFVCRSCDHTIPIE